MLNLNRIPLEKQTHPELSLLNPFNLAVEYSENPVAEFHGDSHYALQICIVLHGEAELIFEDYNSTYSTGELWWSMCWEPHAFRFTGRRNLVIAVNLDIENLGDCGPLGGFNWLTPFTTEPEKRYVPKTAKERKFILDIGKRLFHLRSGKNPAWRIESWLLIHQLILHAVNQMNSAVPHSDPKNETTHAFIRIREALNIIWNLESRPPSLQEAAKLCSLSPSRFSEIFRKNVGVSYGKFASRVRMSFAARDLLAGRMTLEEIAEKWGFFDSAHFCHSFRKFYMVSPSQFITRRSSI